VAEVSPWLASHMDVNGIDLTGVDVELVDDLQRAAADNLKRVLLRSRRDWYEAPGLERMRAWLETKTVWHPMGA
jgi:hypothetical protein